MKKLRTCSSLNLHYHPKDNISEYIRAGLVFYKEMGFDAADLPLPLLDLSSDGWRPCIEKALADSEELGIKFELCHLPFSVKICSDSSLLPEFNERMHRAIDAAALLGVDHAVLHPNTTTLPMEKYNKTEQYDSVMSHLAPFAEHASKVGLNIVVENMRVVPNAVPVHRYCQSPDELCDIADALGIGVCWDFGHAHISGVKQSEGIAYVGKRLKVLHVNDNFGDDDIHILPFTGKIDWRDAMHGLALIGFEGLLNFELSAGRIPAALRRSFVGYALGAAAELMSYIE